MHSKINRSSCIVASLGELMSLNVNTKLMVCVCMCVCVCVRACVRVCVCVCVCVFSVFSRGTHRLSNCNCVLRK